MDALQGPHQTVTLFSVVDPRIVFVEMETSEKLVEAVCDCGASVSYLSHDVDKDLKKTQQTTLEKKHTVFCRRPLASTLPWKESYKLPFVWETNFFIMKLDS